jgi:hypothetical protein
MLNYFYNIFKPNTKLGKVSFVLAIYVMFWFFWYGFLIFLEIFNFSSPNKSIDDFWVVFFHLYVYLIIPLLSFRIPFFLRKIFKWNIIFMFFLHLIFFGLFVLMLFLYIYNNIQYSGF